jgi:4-amino-4-deoxy-L-arabinose transferase-like glycosyltransferase
VVDGGLGRSARSVGGVAMITGTTDDERGRRAAASPDPGAPPAAGRPSPPGPSSPRFRIALAGITVLGLLGRLAWVVGSRHDLTTCDGLLLCGDPVYYSWQSKVVAAGRGFTDLAGTAPRADHPPLTVLLLTPAARLAGEPHVVLAQRFTMALLGAVTIVLVGLLVRRLAGPVAGLAAAAVAVVNANLWINDVTLMAEGPATLLIVATLLATYRFVDRRTWAGAAGVGVLVGLAGLARPELLLLAPVTFAPVALRGRSQPLVRRLGQVALCGGAAFAVLVPWLAYNAGRFQEPVLLSTNDGLTIVATNCGPAYGSADEGGGSWVVGCALEVPVPAGADDSTVNRIYREVGIRYVGRHMREVPRVMALRVIRGFALWGLDQTVAYNRTENRPPAVSWLGIYQWWLLCLAAVPGAVRLHRRRVPTWPLWSLLVITVGTFAVFYGATRFRMATDVLVTVLAGVTLGMAAEAGRTAWRRTRLRDDPAVTP